MTTLFLTFLLLVLTACEQQHHAQCGVTIEKVTLYNFEYYEGREEYREISIIGETEYSEEWLSALKEHPEYLALPHIKASIKFAIENRGSYDFCTNGSSPTDINVSVTLKNISNVPQKNIKVAAVWNIWLMEPIEKKDVGICEKADWCDYYMVSLLKPSETQTITIPSQWNKQSDIKWSKIPDDQIVVGKFLQNIVSVYVVSIDGAPCVSNIVQKTGVCQVVM